MPSLIVLSIPRKPPWLRRSLTSSVPEAPADTALREEVRSTESAERVATLLRDAGDHGLAAVPTEDSSVVYINRAHVVTVQDVEAQPDG